MNFFKYVKRYGTIRYINLDNVVTVDIGKEAINIELRNKLNADIDMNDVSDFDQVCKDLEKKLKNHIKS